MKKFRSSLYWEGRVKYEKLRYLVLALVCVDLLLRIMPESWCRYVDNVFMPAVVLLSLFYSASTMVMLFYPSLSMVNGYRAPNRDMELLSGVPAWQRQTAKLAVNLLTTGILFVLLKIGEDLMGKFADSTHSYFKMQMDLPLPELILTVSVLFPILYLWAYLILYKRDRTRHYLLAWLIAAALYNLPHFAHMGQIWNILIRTAICVPFFIAAGRLEERLHPEE